MLSPKSRIMSAIIGTALLASLCAVPAYADMAIGVRAGTLGFGAEFDIGLSDSFSARLGYDAFSRNQTVTDTDITYKGSLKLGNGSALIDWSPGGAFFHATVGAVATTTKIDVVGVPSAGTYQLGNDTYTSSQIGSVTGQVKMGHSVAPYVGIGFGNPVGKGSALTFMLDLGVVFTGKPVATLNVTCGSAAPQGSATCTSIQQDAQVEIDKLEDNSNHFKLWPVINFGLAYRF